MKKFSTLALPCMMLGAMTVTGCQKPAETAATNTTSTTTTSSSTSESGNTTSKTTTTTTVTTTGSEQDTANMPQIRIATESSFIPFSYKDASGKLIGFEIDLADALCQEAKLKCEVISQDWDGLIPGLKAQKYHAIMAGMSDTAERRQAVAFSDPYYINNLVIIGKKGVDKGADDLAGKSIAVQRATTAADYIAEHFPKATTKAYDTQDNAYLDLEAGRADLMISDSAPALSWLKTEKGQGFEVKGQPINIDDKIAIAFRQNDPLIAKFNAALATLRANGTYDKISQKYFVDTK